MVGLQPKNSTKVVVVLELPYYAKRDSDKSWAVRQPKSCLTFMKVFDRALAQVSVWWITEPGRCVAPAVVAVIYW
jgi:hypothetical protein